MSNAAPRRGRLNAWPIVLTAIGVLVIAVFLLYRRITVIEKLSKFLWVGVVIDDRVGNLCGFDEFRSEAGVRFSAGCFYSAA